MLARGRTGATPLRRMPRRTGSAEPSCETRPEGGTMKVVVDFDVCASTGSCMQVCPEVFEVRSDGYLYVLQEEPPAELRANVTEAAEMYPTGAITVEG